MDKLILLTIISILFQQGTRMNSPDGKFKLTVEIKEESDLQTRYITKLNDIDSKETIEIENCIRRDLSVPNFYWNKDSKYVIFERCSESFKDSRISILNLKTKKIDFELVGLFGNHDNNEQQFDSKNSILIYFDTSIDHRHKVPDLYTFNVRTKKRSKIYAFDVTFEMEFPEVVTVKDKRQINLRYVNHVSGHQIIKQIDY
jgi:hypothetical protein